MLFPGNLPLFKKNSKFASFKASGLPAGFPQAIRKKQTMNTEAITIKDKRFKPYMPAGELKSIIEGLGKRISEDYKGKNPIFVIVLNGAFMFGADLMKAVDLPCRVSLIKVSSYHGTESTQCVNQLIGLQEDIENEDVIIVEDIVDTGVTMEYLLSLLHGKKPKSIAVCSLLFKPGKFTKNFKIDYVGKSIPNDFVVGYGFDYDGYGRNLPDIYSIVE